VPIKTYFIKINASKNIVSLLFTNSKSKVFCLQKCSVASQQGPGAAQEKFEELTLHKVFSPVTHLGFRVWGTLGSRGRVGGVMLVLRTFPELVVRPVQNLVKIGPSGRA